MKQVSSPTTKISRRCIDNNKVTAIITRTLTNDKNRMISKVKKNVMDEGKKKGTVMIK